MSDTNTETRQQGDPEALGDGGKKALDAERARAADAEKRAKAAEARVAELEAAAADLSEKAKQAAMAADAEKQKIEAEKSGLELQVTRMKVGISEGLPMSLIERMQGDDEDSLRADAKELAGYVLDKDPSPFPKADPSQGAKGSGSLTIAEQFAAAFEQ